MGSQAGRSRRQGSHKNNDRAQPPHTVTILLRMATTMIVGYSHMAYEGCR